MMKLVMDCIVSTEVKFYENVEKGTKVAHFGIAYNDYNQPTIFFSSTVFGKNAEKAGKYVTKGMRLLVCCSRMKPVIYKSKESDTEVKNYELIIEDFKMISSDKSEVQESRASIEKQPELSDDIIE